MEIVQFFRTYNIVIFHALDHVVAPEAELLEGGELPRGGSVFAGPPRLDDGERREHEGAE